MKIQHMEESAEKVSGLMKVLSNKNRLMILCQLVEGERTVGELTELLRLRGPAMSQQLALLRKDGLVRTRRKGQAIFYALARDDISRLMAFLYETYCRDGARA
jgi:DNA-binding transcriptional ArsR family regulator